MPFATIKCLWKHKTKSKRTFAFYHCGISGAGLVPIVVISINIKQEKKMQVLGNRQSKPVIGETEFGGYGNSLYYTWNSPINPK